MIMLRALRSILHARAVRQAKAERAETLQAIQRAEAARLEALEPLKAAIRRQDARGQHYALPAAIQATCAALRIEAGR